MNKIFIVIITLLFYQLTVAQNINQVVEGEYFWDTDPGAGNGIALLALDGNFDYAIEELFASGIPTSGLSQGGHTFSVRVKEQDGSWSNTFKQVIHISQPNAILTRTVSVTQGEYFWDADPGVGNGTALIALDGNFDYAIEELFASGIPITGLSQGGHTFSVRVRGQDGLWSSAFKQVIHISQPNTILTRTVNVTQGEYFWDADPGAGNGTALIALDGSFNYVIEEVFANGIPITGLTQGNHVFSVRVKGQDGSWSNTFRQVIYTESNVFCVPTISISSNQGTTICQGEQVTYSASITNGGSNPVYQWKRNGNNVGTGLASYTSSVNNNGDVITCELTSNEACADPTTVTSNALTMTVNASVTPTISISSNQGTTICQGEQVSYTANITNGGSNPAYQWKRNGNNVGTGLASYTTSVNNNGDIITCELTSNEACADPTTVTSNALTMTVNASVTPTISISSNQGTTICQGEPVIYTASITNGGSSPVYQWKLNGNNVGAGLSTYTSSVNSNGDVITCELTSSETCASPIVVTSNALIMTVNSLPTVDITLTSNGLEATSGFISYTWSLDGSVLNGETTHSINPTANGLYEVLVTDANGCESTATFNYTSASIEDGDVVKFNLYPNPSRGVVHLVFPDAQTRLIHVYDNSGKLIYEDNVEVEKVLLNLESLATGTYHLHVEQSQGKLSRVIVVNK